MPKFKTIAEALAYANGEIQPQVDNTLRVDVPPVVSDVFADTAFEVLYDVYKPKVYQRRRRNDGYVDPDNLIVNNKYSVDGKLVVQHIARANPFVEGRMLSDSERSESADFTALIEYGHNGRFAPSGKRGKYRYSFPRRGRAYMKPRPVVGKTKEALANGVYRSTLKSGLEARLPDDAEVI